MKQSEIYALNEANGWFHRVGKEKRFYHTEYILESFDRKNLVTYNNIRMWMFWRRKFDCFKTIC